MAVLSIHKIYHACFCGMIIYGQMMSNDISRDHKLIIKPVPACHAPRQRKEPSTKAANHDVQGELSTSSAQISSFCRNVWPSLRNHNLRYNIYRDYNITIIGSFQTRIPVKLLLYHIKEWISKPMFCACRSAMTGSSQQGSGLVSLGPYSIMPTTTVQRPL